MGKHGQTWAKHGQTWAVLPASSCTRGPQPAARSPPPATPPNTMQQPNAAHAAHTLLKYAPARVRVCGDVMRERHAHPRPVIRDAAPQPHDCLARQLIWFHMYLIHVFRENVLNDGQAITGYDVNRRSLRGRLARVLRRPRRCLHVPLGLRCVLWGSGAMFCGGAGLLLTQGSTQGFGMRPHVTNQPTPPPRNCHSAHLCSTQITARGPRAAMRLGP